MSREEVAARRREARRREIAERILPAVEQLLEENDGFQAVSVEQILTRAGVARASFYRHFSDKSDLLIALAEPILADILEAGMRPFEFKPDMTIGDVERELLRTMEVYGGHIGVFGAMLETSTYDSRVRAKYQEIFREVRATLHDRITDGQRRGYLRPDLPPHQTAGWITWMAERGMSELVGPASQAEREKLAVSLAMLVWHGVYAPRSPD